MATRYWVGGAGTWNSSTTTNWSTASGSTGGASAPTAADDVIIDSASGTGTITVASTAVCNNITVTATQAIVLGVSGAGPLTVSGNLTFPTGGSFTSSAAITFNATTTGKTITSGGKSLWSFTFNGVGGGWSQLDALTLSRTLTLTNGTYNTGNFNLVTSSGTTISSGGTSVLNLGSSTITFYSFNNLNSSGFTLNAGTSNGSFSNNLSSVIPLTFYNVIFTGGTQTVTGSITFNNFTINANSSPGCNFKSFAANQTINGTFSVNSGSLTTNRVALCSASTNFTQITITAAAVSLTNVDFCNINGAGTATWTGTNLGNIGGNSNITFPSAKTVYWNLAGTNNWNATAWATTSGGTPAVGNFPLVQDTAVFNNTGAITTVTINGTYNIGTVNMSARTSAMAFTNANAPIFWGDFILGSGVTVSGGASAPLIMNSYTSQTLTTNGNTILAGISIGQQIPVNATGTLKISGNTTTSAANTRLTLYSGTLDLTNGGLGNYTFTTNAFTLGIASITSGKSITFGTGNITTTGTGTVISAATSTASDFTYTGSGTINVSNNSAVASTINLSGGFSSANALNINITTGTYTLTESSSNVYKNLNYTGFSGTTTPPSSRIIYGDLTYPASGGTFNATTNITSFSAPSGTQTITSNGRTLDFPCTFNGGDSTTYNISGALTLGSTRALTFSNGTIKLTSGTTNTVGSFVTTGSTLKYLTSSVPGTRATIAKSSGTTTVTYLSIKDSNATGGTWDATASTNIDAGNNIGWLFAGNSNYFLLF